MLRGVRYLFVLAACSSVQAEPTEVKAKPASPAVDVKTSCIDDAKPFDTKVMRARLEALGEIAAEVAHEIAAMGGM